MQQDDVPSENARVARVPWNKSRRDLVAAIVSGFVGAMALATSTYNVYLQRQQVRAQVWPRLEYTIGIHRTEGFWIVVANHGVGPARIERVRVKVDGVPVEDWPEAESKLLRSARYQFETVSAIEDKVISPGDDVTAFRIAAEPFGRRVLAERRRLDVEICYCSSLGDCWSLAAPGKGSGRTDSVADCHPDPKPFVSLSEEFLDGLAQEGFSDAGAPGDAAP